MREVEASRKDGKEIEASHFDELTKALATATSRRQALKTIAATALGSILGLGGISTAFANCKPNGIGCNTKSQCCSGGCCHGTCTDLTTTSNCGSCGTTCTGTTPACCSGHCKDLSSDHNNCGSCGHTCDACSTCQNGTCVSSCQGYCCPANYPAACCTPDTFGCCSSDDGCPPEFLCFHGCCLAP